MKHNSRLGAIEASDIFFIILMALFAAAVLISGAISVYEKRTKKEFYSSNGYVEIKYKEVEMWIKKTDIQLINTAPKIENNN